MTPVNNGLAGNYAAAIGTLLRFPKNSLYFVHYNNKSSVRTASTKGRHSLPTTLFSQSFNLVVAKQTLGALF